MTQKLKVRIYGEFVAASPGQSVLQVARAGGKYIPALCYMEGLTAVGSCRLCMVEVQGVHRLLPACTTPVQDGMAVTTSSPQIASYRKIALELLFSERNHVCAVCVSSGHCELQALAQEHGVTHVRYPYNYPRLPVDTSHPRYVLDHNRCVLCCAHGCEGDPLVVAQVQNSSALLGATVTTDGTNILYTPGLNASGADTVEYVVSDGFGRGTNTLSVTVSGQSWNIVSGPTFMNNQFEVAFAGIPNFVYAVDQSTSSASGPWAFYTNLTAAPNGLFQLVVTNDPPVSMRFFRTRAPLP